MNRNYLPRQRVAALFDQIINDMDQINKYGAGFLDANAEKIEIIRSQAARMIGQTRKEDQ